MNPVNLSLAVPAGRGFEYFDATGAALAHPDAVELQRVIPLR